MERGESIEDRSCLDDTCEADSNKEKRTISSFVWPPPSTTTSPASRSRSSSTHGSSSYATISASSKFGMQSPSSTEQPASGTPTSASTRISSSSFQGGTPSTPTSKGRPKPRVSTRLKNLWPPLEAQEAPPNVPGASLSRDSHHSKSSPHTTTAKEKSKSCTGQKFAPSLDATRVRRRSLKTTWPPVAKNTSKTKSKSCQGRIQTQTGLTKARRSIFDKGTVPTGPLEFSDSLHTPRSCHERKSLNPERPESKGTFSILSPGSSIDGSTVGKNSERTESNHSRDAEEFTGALVQGKEIDQAIDAPGSTSESEDLKSSVPQHVFAANEKLPVIVLPSGQKLPPPRKGRSRRRRTSYRIRYGGPTTLNLDVYGPLIDIPEDIPEHDFRFDPSCRDGLMKMPQRISSQNGCNRDTMLRLPSRRASSPTRYEGDSSDSIPSQTSAGEGSMPAEITIEDLNSAESSPEANYRKSPDIWMTPLENDDPEEGRWMLKRVWYIEDMDEKEEAYIVDRQEMIPSIQRLCGVPSDLSDLPEDCAMNTTEEGNVLTPWLIQKIFDIEGVQANSEREVACTADEMKKEIFTILDETGPAVSRPLNSNIIQPAHPKVSDDDDTSLKSDSDDFTEKNMRKESSLESSPQLSNPNETAEVGLRMITLPRGQKLPPPKERKKGRRTNYQIQYGGPTLLKVSEIFDIPEEDHRFQHCRSNDTMMALPRRISHGTGCKDSVPSRPRRSYDYEPDCDGGIVDTIGIKNGDHQDTTSKSKSVFRPNVWLTPSELENPHDELKWKIRRVWEVDEFDEKEEEYTVNDEELMLKVQELFAVPPELRVQSEDDDLDLSPFLMNRVYDEDGEIEEIEEGVELSLDDMAKEILYIAKEIKQSALWWQVSTDPEAQNKPKLPNVRKKKNIGTYAVKETGESGTTARRKSGELGAVAQEEVGTTNLAPKILPWHKKAKPFVKKELKTKLWWQEEV